eukprot:scaffold62820_cov32-Attheya_sp.AAC.6
MGKVRKIAIEVAAVGPGRWCIVGAVVFFLGVAKIGECAIFVAEGNARVDILDETMSRNFQGFGWIKLEQDFVLLHVVHESRVLELEVGELGVGDQGMGNEHFLGFGGLLLDGIVETFSVGFFGGRELEEVGDVGFSILGNDPQGGVLGDEELEDGRVLFGEIKCRLSRRYIKLDFDRSTEALGVQGGHGPMGYAWEGRGDNLGTERRHGRRRSVVVGSGHCQ